MQRNVPWKSLQSCDVFLLAGGGEGCNSNFSLTLPQTLLLVCLSFRGGDVKSGGGGGVVVGEVGRGGVVGEEVGQNREHNV